MNQEKLINLFCHRPNIGLTGSAEGQQLLYRCSEIVIAIAKLSTDTDPVVAKDALLCLVNLSAEDDGAALLLKSVRIDSSFENSNWTKKINQFLFTGTKFGRNMRKKHTQRGVSIGRCLEHGLK